MRGKPKPEIMSLMPMNSKEFQPESQSCREDGCEDSSPPTPFIFLPGASHESESDSSDLESASQVAPTPALLFSNNRLRASPTPCSSWSPFEDAQPLESHPTKKRRISGKSSPEVHGGVYKCRPSPFEDAQLLESPPATKRQPSPEAAMVVIDETDDEKKGGCAPPFFSSKSVASTRRSGHHNVPSVASTRRSGHHNVPSVASTRRSGHCDVHCVASMRRMGMVLSTAFSPTRF